MTIPDPTWPHGTHAWFAFALILGMGLFKLDRGVTMLIRAHYVDRFGWSIITFDLVFAFTFLFGTIETIYPSLRTHGVVFWGTLAPLFLAMLWQWIEIRLVPRQRLHVAMAGTGNGHTWTPDDGERRNGEPGRRQTDYARTVSDG